MDQACHERRGAKSRCSSAYFKKCRVRHYDKIIGAANSTVCEHEENGEPERALVLQAYRQNQHSAHHRDGKGEHKGHLHAELLEGDTEYDVCKELAGCSQQGRQIDLVYSIGKVLEHQVVEQDP